MDTGKPSQAAVSADDPSKPQFYDGPQFTVAGVTDTTNLGGHGSTVAMINRESLAKEAVSLGKKVPAQAHSEPTQERLLRTAIEQHPNDFEANLALGKLLAEEGKYQEALPFLEHAAQSHPDDYESGYLLVTSRIEIGDYAEAHKEIEKLLARQDKAELHHLLADIEERAADPVAAVREYQRAAEMQPSEAYLFDWGAELLAHHATEPAIEVFTKGNRIFPASARMLEGLAVAWYSRGAYDQAVRCLCEAADLNFTDSNPYLFLGKMQAVESAQPEGVAERLGRFARLQPENPLANYYFAVSLWKQRKSSDDLVQVETLLLKAIHLDPKLDIAYVQLGTLYAERGHSTQAIAAYEKAEILNPQLVEAHYRLAQAYRQTGEKTKAQRELQLYGETSKQHEQEVERQRHEIQQFVYKLKNQPSAMPKR
jgi:tetratricopeptide (TPR) repeat protein